PFAIAALLLSPLPGALAQEVQEPPAAPVQEAAPADDAQPQDAPEPEVVPGTQAAPETRDAQPQDPSDPADEPPAPETRDLQQIDDEREAARAVAASDDPDASSASTRVPLEEIKRYVGLFNTIREGYVDPVDDKTLMM